MLTPKSYIPQFLLPGMCEASNKKSQGMTKDKKSSEEAKQSWQPEQMTQDVKWSERELKITDMLRALMEKVDSMQIRMGNLNKEIETQKMYQEEMLEIKTNQKCLW